MVLGSSDVDEGIRAVAVSFLLLSGRWSFDSGLWFSRLGRGEIWELVLVLGDFFFFYFFFSFQEAGS